MKKSLLALAILCSQSLAAQTYGGYVFKVKTGETYTPLTSGTNIAPGYLWDDESYKFPVGFTYKMEDSVLTDFAVALSAGLTGITDTVGTSINGFASFVATDLEDRGWLGGTTAQSPLRYELTGTAPNRIFKFEMANAGFYDELDIYGTQDDSVNIQVWIYETTNIIELHYGSSQVTYPSDYFYLGNAPVIGYIKGVDYDGGTFTKAYVLKGSPSSPTIDSTATDIFSLQTPSAYPANGTVYRFIPKDVAASIGEVEISRDFKVYPTQTSSVINIDYSGNVAACKVSVLDVSGKAMYTQPIEKGVNTLSVSQLPAGFYFIEVSNNEGSAIFKIVKQ